MVDSSLIRKKRRISRNGHSLSLVAIRCHSLYHSLSLVVPLVVIRCHSLYHSLSLVVTCSHSMYLSSVFLQTIQKNSLIGRIRLISKLMTSKTAEQTIAIHILCNTSRSKDNRVMKISSIDRI